MRQTTKGGKTVKRVMVRYTVKPERAAENVELVRAVYDERHGAQAAEGLDIRRSRSRTASASSTSSRPRMNTTPPRRPGLPASRGNPRTLRGRPGRERAARNRLLPARRRLEREARHGRHRDETPASCKPARRGLVTTLSASAGRSRWFASWRSGHGGSPICTTSAWDLDERAGRSLARAPAAPAPTDARDAASFGAV
jgi:hypothetical protein